MIQSRESWLLKQFSVNTGGEAEVVANELPDTEENRDIYHHNAIHLQLAVSRGNIHQTVLLSAACLP